jgi:hypothetical protein
MIVRPDMTRRQVIVSTLVALCAPALSPGSVNADASAELRIGENEAFVPENDYPYFGCTPDPPGQ